MREAGPSEPRFRVFRVRRREAYACGKRLLRSEECIEGLGEAREGRLLLRVLGEDRLVHGERFLVPMQLKKACALFQQGGDHRLVEESGLPVRRGGLLIPFEPLEGGPLAEPRLRAFRFQGDRPVERGDRLLVPLRSLEGKPEEVPRLRVSRSVPRRAVERVRGLFVRVEPVMRTAFLEPQVCGCGVRVDRGVVRAHGVRISAEGEEEGRFPCRCTGVAGIEPKDRVVRRERFVPLPERLERFALRGPCRGVGRIFLEDFRADPQEDLRVLRVTERVPLASQRVEIVRCGNPEPFERRVRLLRLPEGQERPTFVFQGAWMVRLDCEDRVAGGDQLGPPLGRQQELSLRIESIIRARLDREERVEGGDRFLPPIQLHEGVGSRIQRARVARIERHDLGRLLEDVVPAGERPQRLEPADMGRERFRRECNGPVVRGDGIDVPADLVQEPGAALPGDRVAVTLPQGLLVRTQRLFGLVRRRVDVPSKPPGIRVVRVNLDHAVETA